MSSDDRIVSSWRMAAQFGLSSVFVRFPARCLRFCIAAFDGESVPPVSSFLMLSQGVAATEAAELRTYEGKADVGAFLSDMRSAVRTATLAETASTAVAYLNVRSSHH